MGNKIKKRENACWAQTSFGPLNPPRAGPLPRLRQCLVEEPSRTEPFCPSFVVVWLQSNQNGMTPIREYSPQIRNHSAPKNQWDGAAPFQSRSHSHAPFCSLCNQTKNRTAPFQITKHRTERLRSQNQGWNGSVLLGSSTKHYLNSELRSSSYDVIND